MVSDHFQPWRHSGGHAPFSFAWLGALGARTERILMGTSVVTPTFRYHPFPGGAGGGTLGAFFPGRMLLGLGSGESLNEVPATGLEWPDFGSASPARGHRADPRLWSEERVSFDGSFYKTRQATIYDAPPGASPLRRRRGPQVARYAGRVGDGLICTSAKATPSTGSSSCRPSPRGPARPGATPTASTA